MFQQNIISFAQNNLKQFYTEWQHFARLMISKHPHSIHYTWKYGLQIFEFFFVKTTRLFIHSYLLNKDIPSCIRDVKNRRISCHDSNAFKKKSSNTVQDGLCFWAKTWRIWPVGDQLRIIPYPGWSKNNFRRKTLVTRVIWIMFWKMIILVKSNFDFKLQYW